MNNWLDKTEYPFASSWFQVNDQKLHYIDEGQGEVILFVHGTPSWSFEFRNVIKLLRPQFRCVAADHIGFGLSDKPARYDYSTVTHSTTLEKFIVHKQLKDITLVPHDFGGPIGLHYAIQHPGNIKRIVVLNSWLWSSGDDPAFVKFSNLLRNPLLQLLYRYFNFSAAYVLPRSFGKRKLSTALLTQYTKPFINHSERYGVLGFVHSLLNDQPWFESLWNKRKVISRKPALFIWGMKDDFISPAYLEKFREGFDNVTVHECRHSGHFPQEEEPENVALAIADWLVHTAHASIADSQTIKS